MNNTENVTDPNQLKKYARVSGLFYLSVIVFGIFAELTRQSIILEGDVDATVSNIRADEQMYRFAIASDLIMIVSFLAVVLMLYRVFSGTDKQVAFIMVLFVSLSVAILSVNMINHLAPVVMMGDESLQNALTTEQFNSQVYLFVRLHAMGYYVAQLFFALWLFPLGKLVIRSGMMPKAIGYLLMISTASQLLDLFTLILLPDQFALINSILIAPATLGEFAFAFWILIRGVNGTETEQ